MRKLLEENKTFTQIVYDAAHRSADPAANPPTSPTTRTDSPIFKPKFASKSPANKMKQNIIN